MPARKKKEKKVEISTSEAVEKTEGKVSALLENKAKVKEKSFWSGKSGATWAVIFIILIIFSFVMSGVVFYQEQSLTKTSKITPTPIQQAEVTASPTEPISDLKQYSIGILNGSGIAGEATRLKNILTEKGLNVVSVGNADRNNFGQTIIQTKSMVPNSAMSDLENALIPYDSSVSAVFLQETSKVDILITVGSAKLP